MVEPCLMASPWLVLPPEQGMRWVSKEKPPLLPSPGMNQYMVRSNCVNLRLNQRMELWKPTSVLLEGNLSVRIASTIRRPVLIDVQDSHLNSVLFSFGIAEQCTRQENILRHLMSGSNNVERGEIDFPVLFDLMGRQALAVDVHQQPFAPYLENSNSQPSLVYPSSSCYLWKPPLDVAGDLGLNLDKTHHFSGAGARVEMKDILSIISEFYLSTDSMKCTKQAMLVPYFDRKTCKMSKAKGESSAQKLDVKAASLRSSQKTKHQKSPQKKINKNAVKEKNIYRNDYLHACESLLSVMVDKKRHRKTALLSLKKSGPQLPQLLTKLSASIAGTGIALLFSVACKVACGRVVFCASKLLNTGLGLALVWLSCAVKNLSDTVVAINRSPGKLVMREEEMMNNLDKNVKEIYFRAATLLAVAVLSLA